MLGLALGQDPLLDDPPVKCADMYWYNETTGLCHNMSACRDNCWDGTEDGDQLNPLRTCTCAKGCQVKAIYEDLEDKCNDGSFPLVRNLRDEKTLASLKEHGAYVNEDH